MPGIQHHPSRLHVKSIKIHLVFQKRIFSQFMCKISAEYFYQQVGVSGLSATYCISCDDVLGVTRGNQGSREHRNRWNDGGMFPGTYHIRGWRKGKSSLFPSLFSIITLERLPRTLQHDPKCSHACRSTTLQLIDFQGSRVFDGEIKQSKNILF